MERLSPEQRAAIEQQLADDDAAQAAADEFDVDVWDDAGNGARMPFSKAAQWLSAKGFLPAPEPADPDDGAPDPHAKPAGQRKAPAKPAGDKVVRFGRTVA